MAKTNRKKFERVSKTGNRTSRKKQYAEMPAVIKELMKPVPEINARAFDSTVLIGVFKSLGL